MAVVLVVPVGECRELSRTVPDLEEEWLRQTIARHVRYAPIQTGATKFAWPLLICVDWTYRSRISTPFWLPIVMLRVAQTRKELCRLRIAECCPARMVAMRAGNI